MNVTAYICGDKLKAIERGHSPIVYDGPGYITVDDGAVEFPLLPNSVNTDSYYIDIYIHAAASKLSRLCRIAGTMSWNLNWNIISGKTSYIIIEYSNPDICDWERTEITTTFGLFSVTIQPTTGHGRCSDNKADVLGGEGDYTVMTDVLVPGEATHLKWKFKSYKSSQYIKTDYIHSCCLTGGTVKAVNGSYGTSNISYDVRVEGILYQNIVSTDFYQYSVGDWVFILKPGGSCSLPKDGAVCEGHPYTDYVSAGGAGIILPLKIGNIGP